MSDNITAITGGKKKNDEDEQLLDVAITFKDGSEANYLCNFMGHSQENPMMITFIIATKDAELPVGIVNCDTVKYIDIKEVSADEV